MYGAKTAFPWPPDHLDLDRRKVEKIAPPWPQAAGGSCQDIFDAMCSNIDAVRPSRAAAASSAVPLVLSPLTLNNYGGSCNYEPPLALNRFACSPEARRAAACAKREVEERLAFADGAKRPYIHLFDRGVADNVGMRSVLTVPDLMETLKLEGVPTRLDKVRRFVVFVVNAVSSPRTDWDEREKAPGPVNLMLKASVASRSTTTPTRPSSCSRTSSTAGSRCASCGGRRHSPAISIRKLRGNCGVRMSMFLQSTFRLPR